MRLFFRLVALYLLLGLPGTARAQEQIRIVGSGTLYPFVTVAAEQFGQSGTFATPVVESTGTGGGLKLFCEGSGATTPDIANASRKITTSEKEQCAKHSVAEPLELPLGYDGIILASKKGVPLFGLTKKQVFMALARLLPDKSGILSANTYQRWKEIDPSLPNQPITIYGPGTVSGTRDAFAELVMEKGCENFAEFKRDYPDDKVRKKLCQAIREDGKYVETGEDYNITVQKLVSNEQALGIFGYGFYSQNRAKIQASPIDGVVPENETILSGAYGVSRGLYMYVKREHVGKMPGLGEFIQEITSDDAIGTEGYLTARGLIPLSDGDRAALTEKVKSLGANEQ